MIENLSSAIKEDEELDEHLNTLTTQHLQPLKTVLKQYFPELNLKNKKPHSYEIRSQLL